MTAPSDSGAERRTPRPAGAQARPARIRRRDGLPRIAQAVAAPATRNTGVDQNEAELLRASAGAVQKSVLAAYPHHDQAAVGDWMLLAAIEALIDGHAYLANYHMAWFVVLSGRGGAQQLVT